MRKQPQKNHMKKSTNMMIACAAMAGLYTGALAVRASASTAHAGKVIFADDSKDKSKHDCKGKGGCKSSENGCKGKNDCKGKGGCSTMKDEPKPST